MRFSTILSLSGGIVASAVAHPDKSNGLYSTESTTPNVERAAQSDLDPSVWKNLLSAPQPKRSNLDSSRNRPVKRQSGWTPPSDLKAPLQEVWDHYVKTYDGGLDANVNTGFHQIMANKGYLNICVRWDSSATLTEAQRTKIAKVYDQQYQKWFKWLYGYNGFPYSNVKVNIVGYAVKNKSQLQGSTTGYDVYTELDADGIPMCPVACARDAHLDGDYSGCKAGADRHYDHSLWLTDGLEGGFGHNWGQQVGREYFMNNLDSDNIHILLHEMGHTFALDDFYDWTPTGITKFIMLAGASMEITDFDGWMLRNWWYYLSQKNKWSSTKASASAASSTAITPAKAADKVVTTTKAATKATTTKATATKAAATSVPVVSTGGNAGKTVAAWGQCGGGNWAGATKCAAGLKCTKNNDFYSQCVPN
ncbi:Ff.00g000440.m01.CDS01 [Fusarium sp. VM40]|nr:Ff.00g000440.m01.CDS01 [Fusarium sp. VM40]